MLNIYFCDDLKGIRFLGLNWAKIKIEIWYLELNFMKQFHIKFMKSNFYESYCQVILFVALYLLCAVMVYGFFYLDGSIDLKETLNTVDRHSTSTGLKFYALVGIFQYGLLICGISIFSTLTFMIVKSKIRSKNGI